MVPGEGSARPEGCDPGETAVTCISFASNLEVPAEHPRGAGTPGVMDGCSRGARKGLVSGSGQHPWCRPQDAPSHLDSLGVHIDFIS